MAGVSAKKALAAGALVIVVGATLIALTPVLDPAAVEDAPAASSESRGMASQRVSLDPQTGAIRRQPLEAKPRPGVAAATRRNAAAVAPQWQEEVGSHGGVSLAVPQSASAELKYQVPGRKTSEPSESQSE